MQNILLIAYHFPPAAVSSGHLRTLALTRHLPQFGWNPIVLSAHPRAYSRTDDKSLTSIPHDVPVTRAFALDARRHLGVNGRYPLLLAQPDRWASWWVGAVPAGLGLIKRYRPAAIWSTYPITSAHLIAHTLHKITGLPWIADFRDPITASDVGSSALTTRTRNRIERKTINHSSYNVFTTEGAAKLYAERYAWRRPEGFVVIPNGYDESDFEDYSLGELPERNASSPLKLVHSGVLYRDQRDPTAFFAALAELVSTNEISADMLTVVFRASGDEKHFSRLIQDAQLSDIVELRPPVPYSEALKEQRDANGLLIFQGSGYNRQIPAKVYEYLRIGRPICALTDPDGDTAAVLADTGVAAIADMTSKGAIVPVLRQFITGIRNNTLPILTAEQVLQYSRRAGAEKLAKLLDQATNTTTPEYAHRAK